MSYIKPATSNSINDFFISLSDFLMLVPLAHDGQQ